MVAEGLVLSPTTSLVRLKPFFNQAERGREQLKQRLEVRKKRKVNSIRKLEQNYLIRGL